MFPPALYFSSEAKFAEPFLFHIAVCFEVSALSILSKFHGLYNIILSCSASFFLFFSLYPFFIICCLSVLVQLVLSSFDPGPFPFLVCNVL